MTEVGQSRAPAMFLLGTLVIGGSETKFVRLARRLHDEGHPIHLAYLRPPDDLLPMTSGIPTEHLGQTSKLSWSALKNLRRYIDANDIRSIVNVNLFPLVYSAAACALSGSDQPRNIASINTSEFGTRRDRNFMQLYKRLLRRTDKLVFGSVSQKDDWIRSFRLPVRNSSVIYNGVDGSQFDPGKAGLNGDEVRKRLGISDGDVVVACVSQFRPEKGHVLLLRALAALKARDLPTPHVILVGDGAERDQIVSESRKLAVSDSVTLAGAVDDVRPYLAAADVFVLPSIAVETFSNAALEASAMGLRCVISDVGGAHEMFPDGSFGVVYHRESMDELTDALATAVRSGRPTTEDRDAVRTDILSRFGIDGMVEDWKEILWPSTAVDRQAAG